MFRFTRRHERPDGVERVWAACSALLDYPTQALVDGLDEVQAFAGDHARLTPLIEHLRVTPLRQSQEEYVETFDLARKCALYLTYFSYGDTRRRGVALVQFKQAYRAAGAAWDETSAELPDHLCAVLEFGASIDADAAWRLLLDHRAGLEMLRLALAGWERSGSRGVGSPWLAGVCAVCDTLPPLHGDEAEAVRRLVEQGPPAEEVGLEPYGSGLAMDPALATSMGAPR